MGWSMRGILAGAGKGMSDWATAGMAADRQAERDAAQFERQKELQTHQDSLAAAREKSSLELKDKYAEKKADQERERKALTMQLGDEDAKAKGLKPGTKDYNLFMGDFLRQSDMPDIGEKYISQADKFDDNDMKRKQIEAQLAAVGESRQGRNDAKVAAADAKRWAIEAKQIETLGTHAIRTPDPENPGKTLTIKDESGQASLLNLYQKTNGNMELISEAGAGGQALFRSDPKTYPTLGSAIDKFALEMIKKKKAEAAAKK